MSGPKEVERLIKIVAAGVREKMMRPKCLERPSWRTDSDRALLRRLHEEDDEFHRAYIAFRNSLIAFDARDPLTAEQRLEMVRTVWDMAAFAAMLIDPKRDPVAFGTATGENRANGSGEPYR